MIVMNPGKCFGQRSNTFVHSGVMVETVEMKLFFSDQNVGIFVSLNLGFPMSHFYTRSIYFNMSLEENKLLVRRYKETK